MRCTTSPVTPAQGRPTARALTASVPSGGWSPPPGRRSPPPGPVPRRPPRPRQRLAAAGRNTQVTAFLTRITGTRADRPRATGAARPVGLWAFTGVAVMSFGGPLALAALYAPTIVTDASASA